jgi:cbb3-type cytochrome oxidase cytochrome c subunit
MTHRHLLLTALLLVIAPAARAVDPSDLKPGLVATYSDGKQSVTRLEPTVSLTVYRKESPHPRLNGSSQVNWKGYINVVRPGKYQFGAGLAGGELDLMVDSKLVLNRSPSTTSGSGVVLEGGVHAFEVSLTTKPGDILIELLWQGPGFKWEPIPHQYLGHLPKDRPASFARDAELEHGRFKFEELACIRCHKPAAGDAMAKTLADRPAPNLAEVGKRAFPGWIDAWLADPSKLRPHTSMPKMFADTAAGRAERYAVVRYLVAVAGNNPPEPVRPPTLSNDYRQSMERGKVLYTTTGCAACHQEPLPRKAARNDEDEKDPLMPEDHIYGAGTPGGPATKYSLGAVGSKYKPEALAAFLQNPLKVNPSGRMPHMNLDPRESLDIARFLCRLTDDRLPSAMPSAKGLKPDLIAESVLDAAELEAFGRQKPDAQWLDLGRKLLLTKGCVNCHAVEPGGKALAAAATLPTLVEVRKAGGKGCLSPQPHAGEAPEYKLDKAEMVSIGAFLTDGLTGAGSPSPNHAARVALKRFNCLNCHSRDGEGGIPPELVDAIKPFEKAENAEEIRPPLLTGIGHKSRTSWLKAVLTQGGRARPWMSLRMPQYGEANVGFLPHAFAALEGTTPDDTVKKVAITPDKINAGKTIIGKAGLGCISCHDISGIPNTGTRGPDLATINQRVRYDWYERWLHQPLRMAPGTRMPQAFIDDKSTLTTVLGGNADAQAEAMWAYLSLGPGLPLPEGMEPPKGLIVVVKDRPELLRTFMPDAGTKAIAVGYPGGVSAAFSADQCRLSYTWAGNFLDASPVWNNRGGNPAKLLGPKFWTAPPGHPWGLTANPRVPPDFPGRSNNPAFGAPLPYNDPPRMYDGPRAVSFDGYSVGKDGRPTFRYRLTENANGAVLAVAETPSPLKAAVAAGVQRQFRVELPSRYRAWFLAGTSTKEPRLVGVNGKPVPFDLSAAEPTADPANVRVVLPDGDRATVLELAAPAGVEWRFVKSGGSWQALVRFPETDHPLGLGFSLNVWGLSKDDDALLSGLTSK